MGGVHRGIGYRHDRLRLLERNGARSSRYERLAVLALLLGSDGSRAADGIKGIRVGCGHGINRL